MIEGCIEALAIAQGVFKARGTPYVIVETGRSDIDASIELPHSRSGTGAYLIAYGALIAGHAVTI